MPLGTLELASTGGLFGAGGILATGKRLIKRYGKKSNLPCLIRSESLRGTTNLGTHDMMHV